MSRKLGLWVERGLGQGGGSWESVEGGGSMDLPGICSVRVRAPARPHTDSRQQEGPDSEGKLSPAGMAQRLSVDL